MDEFVGPERLVHCQFLGVPLRAVALYEPAGRFPVDECQPGQTGLGRTCDSWPVGLGFLEMARVWLVDDDLGDWGANRAE